MQKLDTFLPDKFFKSQFVCRFVSCIVLALVYITALSNVFSCNLSAIPGNCTQYIGNVTVMIERPHVNLYGHCRYPQYISFTIFLVMIACAVFLHIHSMVKAAFIGSMGGIYVLLILFKYRELFDWHDHYSACGQKVKHVALYVESISMTFYLIVGLICHGYMHEQIVRLDFLWKAQATQEKDEMEDKRKYNKKLLHNILPSHVAEYFLQDRPSDDLYAQACTSVAVMFSNICNFSEFYLELETTGDGLECLRVLNQIIVDFDNLLSRSEFKTVEKIKTIGETYMAAAGLNIQTPEELQTYEHVEEMALFAIAMKDILDEMNRNAFNNFQIKSGLNLGPVVAGVIGVKKPQYDIWGDTVNVASRMYSTGKANCIQVTQSVYNLLSKRGFIFECRGLVRVKGKGKMITYWLKGKEGS